MVRSFPLNLLAFVAVVGTCTARAAEDAARDGIHGSSNYDTEAHSDRIENLPGFEEPLPSKQYAGYLSIPGDDDEAQASPTKFLHYWFVESEGDPQNDPVVLWLNGGPGCSSMDGFFNEQGPFEISDNLTLSLRSTRWTKMANMIWLDAPAGVGLSYATTKQGYVHNDTSTAIDNYYALLNFFQEFTEFQDNDFYITGESYAGIYIPTLANQIHKHNNQLSSTSSASIQVNLKGIMVGNGCIGTEVGSCSISHVLPVHIDYLNRMGLFSDVLYSKVQDTCSPNITEDCLENLISVVFEVGPISIYNVLGKCVNGELLGGSRSSRRPTSPVEKMIYSILKSRYEVSDLPPFGPLECGLQSPTMSNYLDSDSVRKAIHAQPVSMIGNFSICENNITYTSTEPNLPRDVYPTLIDNYRVTIYNGDADACVPFPDNEKWTSNMNITVKNSWRAWYTSGSGNDQQVAGYITQYENDFNFVIVKGAGHMVPQFKPEEAYQMFQHFLNNNWPN